MRHVNQVLCLMGIVLAAFITTSLACSPSDSTNGEASQETTRTKENIIDGVDALGTVDTAATSDASDTLDVAIPEAPQESLSADEPTLETTSEAPSTEVLPEAPQDTLPEASPEEQPEAPVNARKPSVKGVLSATTIPQGGKVTLRLEFKNFTMDGTKAGQPPKANEGHYHLYLDKKTGNDYLPHPFELVVDVIIPKDTSVGAHTLRISLRGNDHNPLTPPVDAFIPFTVTASP